MSDIYNINNIQGKKLIFSSVFVNRNFAYFNIDETDDKLVLHLHDNKEMKIYEEINTFIYYQWRETGYPFPIEIEFEEREKTEKNAKEDH